MEIFNKIMKYFGYQKINKKQPINLSKDSVLFKTIFQTNNGYNWVFGNGTYINLIDKRCIKIKNIVFNMEYQIINFNIEYNNKIEEFYLTVKCAEEIGFIYFNALQKLNIKFENNNL